MDRRYAGIDKRWTWAILAVVLLVACYLAVVVFKGAGRGGPVLAGQQKKPDAKRDADANESAPDENDQRKDANEEPMRPPDHNHPAFKERVKEREKMVAWQIKDRGVGDANALRAMRTVPRHAFVRRGDRRRAYGDYPIPIGLNQTISQPYIVAYMTEALKLDANSKVFEVGTGSGYQAAACAEIAKEVYTVEIIGKLAVSAKDRLKKLGYHNVRVRHADGYYGWKQKGPFDAIIITAATDLVPPPLKQQLKPGGRMILPLGSPYGAQVLVLITKDADGTIRSRRLMGVQFVPMTGRVLRGEGPDKK
ncbi:MAG: protein-L-isoaspartate(D-aspartate) O-methyltransferase [Planctomycetota bacterium]|jgi:protein-L-isoaspartate(D-aspartate) O-methyltransferase